MVTNILIIKHGNTIEILTISCACIIFYFNYVGFNSLSSISYSTCIVGIYGGHVLGRNQTKISPNKCACALSYQICMRVRLKDTWSDGSYKLQSKLLRCCSSRKPAWGLTALMYLHCNNLLWWFDSFSNFTET